MEVVRMAEEKHGSKGGKARAAALTPQERSEIASTAVNARWAKAGKEGVPRATHEGPLVIGEITFDTAVLDDGTRVISESKFMEAMGMYRSGALSTRRKAGAQVPLSLSHKNLKPFVEKHFNDVHYNPIRYQTMAGSFSSHGIRADVLPTICEVWLDARKEGVLGPTQEKVAERADILIRSFAKVGIIALIDEATGFQYERQKTDLQELLAAFLQEELRRWVKTFPNQYFKEMCRLRKITYRPDMRLPQYFGHLTNDVVYDRLAPGVLDEMKERTEKDGEGRRKARFHQWLTDDLGHPKLVQHLGLVIGLMRISDEWDEFIIHLDKAAPSFTKEPLFAAAVATTSATD
jgi:hypothetical protein